MYLHQVTPNHQGELGINHRIHRRRRIQLVPVSKVETGTNLKFPLLRRTLTP